MLVMIYFSVQTRVTGTEPGGELGPWRLVEHFCLLFLVSSLNCLHIVFDHLACLSVSLTDLWIF